VSDAIGPVLAALADPTRRHVVERLLREGSTTVPALTSALPMTRQAVAKHLAALGEAGLVERASQAARPVTSPSGTPPPGWLTDSVERPGQR
jgi:DNA-binding transcriptional ArsR family regulator